MNVWHKQMVHEDLLRMGVVRGLLFFVGIWGTLSECYVFGAHVCLSGQQLQRLVALLLVSVWQREALKGPGRQNTSFVHVKDCLGRITLISHLMQTPLNIMTKAENRHTIGSPATFLH